MQFLWNNVTVLYQTFPRNWDFTKFKWRAPGLMLITHDLSNGESAKCTASARINQQWQLASQTVQVSIPYAFLKLWLISQSTLVHINSVSYCFMKQAAACVEVSLLPTGGKSWVSHAWKLQNGYSVGLAQAPDNEGNCASPNLGETGCRCAIELYAWNRGSRVHQRTLKWWCGLWWVVDKRWCHQMWKCETFSNPLLHDSNRKMDPMCPLPTFS